jgi:CHAD domain-containing protein
MHGYTYILTDAVDVNELLAGLHDRYRFMPEKRRTVRETYLDTFDWRLYARGRILIRQQGEFTLCDLGPSPRRPIAGSIIAAAHSFWQDFNAGPLRDELRAVLGIRALVPLVSVRRSSQLFKLLNQDEKTVHWLELGDIAVFRGGQLSPLHRAITLRPVKGYLKALKRVRSHLEGLGLEARSECLALEAIRSAGLKPGGYSSKPSVSLEPDVPAGDAAVRILAQLAGVIRQNEPGVRNNTDTEFLHDFRVSVRKTRAALSQIKGVFPAEDVRRYADGFRRIGKLTNRPRDLDVYLLKRDSYRAMLPEYLADALDPMFTSLEAERKREYRKLARALRQPWYTTLLDTWQVFLDGSQADGPEEPKHAGTPIGMRADKRIRRRYHRVKDLGGALTDTSPEAEFHRLRIECKKLRYLMEFFSTLYHEDGIQMLVGQLKRLQDNLGDYNDLAVQQAEMRTYLDDMVRGDDMSPEAAAAVGGLVATLNRKQVSVRKGFRAAYEAFVARDNTRRFDKLLSARGKRTG